MVHNPQTSLTREHKEAIGLLSIGTFLEYFDLMLYVHMAPLLNELFFPKSDAFTSSLLTAFAFCSTYILRPIGALIFGWLGDNWGRKSTVVLTTMLMAFSCVCMAILPIYAKIGITASWIITICRIVQGMTSMGEFIGATLYLTELIKPPIQYPVVASLTIFVALGTMCSIGVASLATLPGFSWRWAFLIGAAIALVGSVARTALKETPEFVDAKRRLKKVFENFDINTAEINHSQIVQEKVKMKNALAYFLIECGWPVCLYFAYFYCGEIMKSSFHYSAVEVIHQNFIVSIFQIIGFIIVTISGIYIYPLKFLRIKVYLFLIFACICPYFLNHLSNPNELLIIQIISMILGLGGAPGFPIFYKNFPVFKRFTSASFIYALSRALVYVITAFGLIFLQRYYGHLSFAIVAVPVAIGYCWGINHFENLEKANGTYPI